MKLSTLRFFVLLIVMINLLAFLFLLYLKNKSLSEMNKPSQTPQLSITGVIRSSGLSPLEKERLLIYTADLQITSITNQDHTQTDGYFLNTLDQKYKGLLGKCVTLLGAIPEDWEGVPENNFTLYNLNTYNRSLISPQSVSIQPFENCNPYPSQTSDPLSGIRPEREFTGILTRAERPAPDIDYDYIMVLDEPTNEMMSSAGNAPTYKEIDVKPSSNELWRAFERAIGSRVAVKGFLTWGYSESRYIEVTSLTVLEQPED